MTCYVQSIQHLCCLHIGRFQQILYHCYFLVPYSIKIWIINIKQHNFQPWQTLLTTSQAWCSATTVSPDCGKQRFEEVVGARREPLLYGMRMSGEGEGCQTRCHCLPHRHAHILILTICKIENKNSSVALLLVLCIKSKSCYYNTEIMRTLDYIHIQVCILLFKTFMKNYITTAHNSSWSTVKVLLSFTWAHVLS